MISEPFDRLYQKYQQLQNREARDQWIKQLIAAAYIMTVNTHNTRARSCVLAIGNRHRQSQYKRMSRRNIRTLWQIALYPDPQDIILIEQFLRRVQAGTAASLFQRPAQKPRKTAQKSLKKPEQYQSTPEITDSLELQPPANWQMPVHQHQPVVIHHRPRRRI